MTSVKKQELRQDLRRVIHNLDERWKKAACVEVGAHLSTLIDEGLGYEVNRILAWTVAFKGEIDLSAFIARQLRHREVYLPRMSLDGQMMFIRVDERWSSELEIGPVGVPEPKFREEWILNTDSLEDALVVVPGLAFDIQGNRLGRGKGHYDRFLGRSGMDEITRVGVCWSVQFLQHVPTEPFDNSMDWICHERGYVESVRA